MSRERACRNCGNLFFTTNKWYCSDECRTEGRRATYRAYRNRTEGRPTESRRLKLLETSDLNSKFTIGAKMVRGTVMLRNKERRAILFRTPANSKNDPILIEYLTPGIVDTVCPPYIKHTFVPLNERPRK